MMNNNNQLTFHHDNPPFAVKHDVYLEKEQMQSRLEEKEKEDIMALRVEDDEDADHHYTCYEKKPHSTVKNEDRFPLKLYDLLQKSSKEGFENIVSWFPCGKMFRIHNQKKFEAEIMPNFFPGMTSYKSFCRQLNLYGINQKVSNQILKEKKVLGGLGAYLHPFLVRDHRELCFKIERVHQQTSKRLMSTTISPPKAQRSDTMAHHHQDMMRMADFDNEMGFLHGVEYVVDDDDDISLEKQQ